MVSFFNTSDAVGISSSCSNSREGISGKFNSVGSGINSYGTTARNATAPNAGSATAVKKTAVKKTDSKPKAGGQKALPSSKPMKALPAPPTKKDVKTPYTPPYPTKKKEPVKTLTAPAKKDVKAPYIPPASVNTQEPERNTRRGAKGRKKVMPEKQSLPSYSPAPQRNAYAANSGPKPAIPGYGASKTGSVAGSVSKGGYKPAVSGYGGAAKSQAGSVAGSVAGGGPSFF